ncbi:hypothetical protein [Nocardioides daeguensis]|uniref:Uncharacterized protein n=1 Tax=Nocardioides daeguensis TaxID=908359 RepID=A0ABP6VZT0_9ACTN|nr:hypothetical protein [Nocardioides daeguensis]MBV6726816.1 hypothetical protein [Nocardioides daeguensis]MCR1774432.1 hypothetical protein [Nocardioides daeguensis]
MLRRHLPLVVTLVAALAVGLLLLRGTGGDEDPFAAYCSAVTERREDIGAALGAGPTTGLLRALPSFEALAEESPEDIRADWSLVVERIRALKDALDDAGVDASTYNVEEPPTGLPAADKEAIDTAAVRLGAAETATALSHVEQQARDVCKTPLSM